VGQAPGFDEGAHALRTGRLGRRTGLSGCRHAVLSDGP
jgi:hypothetical protein